jgi:molybdopterin-guanine dinucleotide biosynthesis protein A
VLGAIILAGGKGNRIGGDKPLIRLGGKELILHVCEAVEEVSDELVVVVSRREVIKLYERILPEGVELTTDIGGGGGPLVGACSGLRRVRSEYALVLPCDTPFVSVPALRYIAERSKGYDAAVPRWPNGYTEPLHSVYRVKASIKACTDTMVERDFRISGMISRLRTIYVPVEEVRKLDPELLTFFNVNSHEDLNKAEEILKSRDKV